MSKHIFGYLRKNTYKIYGLKTIHYLFTVVVFYVSFLLFRYGTLHIENYYGYRYNYYAAVLYGVMILFFSKTYNSYLLGYSRIRTLVLGQALSQISSIVLLYFLISLAWNHFISPLIFLPMLAVQFVFDVIWSYFGNSIYYKLIGTKRTLLIYRSQVDKRRFGNIYGKPLGRSFKILEELQFDGTFPEIQKKLAEYDAVFVSGVNSSCRNGILKYCKENKIAGFFLPHIGDTIMQAATHVKSFDAPVLYVNRKELEPEYAVIKRAFDIVSSGIALILLSPILLITALVIYFYDGGPAFYRQTRLTRDSKEFQILKFRSMRVDAEKDGVARLSQGENDDRITPVGKIVRRFRLDELPQLWNILKGDMSVVGPRPERPEIAEEYYKTMPDFRLRLQVKAGLTGYAQVYGRYNTAPYEKLEFDLLYINNMNILVDLQLCFATILTLFKKDSTEGVAGITALESDLDELEEMEDSNE